ncbi:MAG: glycosyltransferase, partial [Nitrospinota bacterium]
MRLALFSPPAWKAPSPHCAQWEAVVAGLAQGLEQEGISVHRFPAAVEEDEYSLSPPGSSREQGIKVGEYLAWSDAFEQAEGFDLIHTYGDFFPLSYLGLTTTPVVATIHDLCSPPSLPVYKRYNPRVYYVAVSEASRSSELRYLATIYPGVAVQAFPFHPEPADYLFFGYGIHPESGVEEAISIAREAGMKLRVMGTVEDRPYYEQVVRPHLDGGWVELIGEGNLDSWRQGVSRALAFLHPIRSGASMPLAVLEAMACGTPVIAFRQGVMSELIQEGVSGFLADTVAEAVQAISRIKTLAREQCREHVATRFSLQQMVERYLQVYRTVLEQNRREDHRPWGYYEVLSDKPDHKVKRIVVHPGQRLSLQRHHHRAEHWHVIRGKALVTRDKEQISLEAGESIDIPRGATHRVQNPGSEPLVFIEVQRGDYFGEDDIER